MADKVDEQIENDVCAKKKDIVDSPVKDKSTKDKVSEEKADKENGKVCESENGRTDEVEEIDAKESDDIVCPVKRKSGGGGDAPDEKAAEDVTPEKKAKLDDVAAEAESNDKAEVPA